MMLLRGDTFSVIFGRELEVATWALAACAGPVIVCRCRRARSTAAPPLTVCYCHQQDALHSRLATECPENDWRLSHATRPYTLNAMVDAAASETVVHEARFGTGPHVPVHRLSVTQETFSKGRPCCTAMLTMDDTVPMSRLSDKSRAASCRCVDQLRIPARGVVRRIHLQ